MYMYRDYHSTHYYALFPTDLDFIITLEPLDAVNLEAGATDEPRGKSISLNPYSAFEAQTEIWSFKK